MFLYDNGTMIQAGEDGTFQDQVSKVFNNLPKNIREINIIKQILCLDKKNIF